MPPKKKKDKKKKGKKNEAVKEEETEYDSMDLEMLQEVVGVRRRAGAVARNLEWPKPTKCRCQC